MPRLLLSLGLAALLASPSMAPAQPAASAVPSSAKLTLDEAQVLAAARSAELAAAMRGVEAADGAVQQAGARPNPELNALAEDTRWSTRTTTATIGYPLELGGKRAARIGAAERARDLSSAQLNEARSNVRAAVIAAYFATAVAQERVKLAIDSANLAARAADVVGKRVKAGKTSPVDNTRAAVDLANARLEVSDANADLKSARQSLAALWGDAEPRFAEVAGDLDAVPTRAPNAELIRQVDDAPTLISDRLEIDRRNAVVGVERSKAVPNLLVSVGAKRDNQVGRTQAVIGVSIPLPLFDRNQGAIYEASKQAERAEDEYAAARIRLTADVNQAATQLATAQASLQALRDTVLPAAQLAYSNSTTGFEAGKFGFLDVIDSQRALLQARARYLTTLTAAYQAATAIDRLLGR